nr:dr1-associated corepressor isoform X2 [Parasteatoda tepidariorum]
MQTDEDIGKVAAPVPVIISRALELFVESLVTKTSLITKSRNAKTLTSSHLKACVLADNNFKFLRDLVSSVPDVQGEEEQMNPCITDDNILSGNDHEVRSVRGRRPKDKGTSEDSAGPSHSTADESETWSAEEDGEEDTDCSTDSAPSHSVISSLPSAPIPPLPCNVAFAASASHHYVPHLQPVSNNSTSNNIDDDYDS